MRGWIVGEEGREGRIFQTTNGGTSWTSSVLRLEGFDWVNPCDVIFVNNTLGWIVGSVEKAGGEAPVIFRSVNGGQTWQLHTMMEDSSGTADGDLQRLMADANGQLYAAGSAGVVRLDPVSQQWKVYGSRSSLRGQTVFNAYLHGQTSGWIVTDEGLSQTTDGDLSWQAAQVEAVSERLWLTALSFAGPNEGWAGGNEGRLLHTIDGGKTWRLESIGLCSFVRDIAVTARFVFAVGNDGKILARSRTWPSGTPVKT